MNETFISQIGFVLAIFFVAVFYIPVAYMRRRMKKMSETDLLKINRKEWIRQVKSNAYTKLIGRGFVGLLFVGFILFNYKLIIENGIDFSTVLFSIIGILFICFAFFGYKNEFSRLKEIDCNLTD